MKKVLFMLLLATLLLAATGSAFAGYYSYPYAYPCPPRYETHVVYDAPRIVYDAPRLVYDAPRVVYRIAPPPPPPPPVIRYYKVPVLEYPRCYPYY